MLWYIVLFIVLYKLLDYLVRFPRYTDYDKRYIFITGCDSGFGFEAAKKFDSLGCNVIAGCLTENGETQLRKVCSKRLLTVPLNVTKHESVLKAYELTVQHLPKGKGLWGVLNNAGMAGNHAGVADWLELEDYVTAININLLGGIDVTTTFLPLIKREHGRIVNTSSIVGRNAVAINAAYSVSKYGVEAFSDVIRRELRPFKVSVHMVEPGSFKTNLTNTERYKGSVKAAWDRMSEEKRQEYGPEFLQACYEVVAGATFQLLVNGRLSDVVDAYEHALFGWFPRARYVVGMDAKFGFLPVQWLPEWLGDWILMQMMALPKPAALRKK